MDENKDNLSFENLTEEAVLKIKPKKKKIVLYSVLSAVAVFVIAVIGVLVFAICDINGVYNKQDKAIAIKRGSTTSGIAETLKQEGIIKSPLLFRVYSRVKGYDSKFLFGTFNVNAKDGYEDIAKRLMDENASFETVTVTIPEGTGINDYIKDVNGSDVTVPGIATLLERAGVCNKEDFYKALNSVNLDKELLSSIDKDGSYYALEGYLFPDTYAFYAYDSEECAVLAVEKMLGQMENVITKDMIKAANERGMSVNEVLTLASIVQMEAGLDIEGMPKVAAVFYNRMANGVKIGSSPTCYYGNSFSSDDGRYDTYKIKGLPPGPLCSPGKAAINAVLYPEENFDGYLYFVTDKNGKFYFHKNYSQQTATINRLKREGKWIYEYLD